MRTFQDAHGNEAFNIFELVAVIAIVALIAATFLHKKPPPPARQQGYRARCMDNQREIATALLAWSANSDDFPWQTKDHGTQGFIASGDASLQFKTLSSYVKDPRVFLCPSDRLRIAAADYATLHSTNLSYFVNVDAKKISTNTAQVVLIGDRHLKYAEEAVKPGLFVVTNGMSLSWSQELHINSPNSPAGTMAFADGHVERFSTINTNLNPVFAAQNLERTRLLIP